MFDLHSHILPRIDDGASDLATSLEMARIYQAQGIECVACTPHILPGVYHNTGPQIRAATEELQSQVYEAGIDLRLVPGADNHIVPNFVGGITDGHLLCLGDTRYVLVEPPHHVALPRLDDFFFDILVADYVPVLTHPERLSWIESEYDRIVAMARRGVWMQVTSGSLLGRFGRRPKYWAERMLSEGLVHILASDAHNTKSRPPDLAKGHTAAEQLVGSLEARHLVYTRPRGMLLNQEPTELPPAFDAMRESMIGRVRATRGTGNEYAGQTATDAGVSLLDRVRHVFSK